MPVRARPLSRFTATVAAAALSFGLLAVTPGVALAEDKTTFLGLEGEGDPVLALSDALRWDLNQRGRDDGNTMTLAELKLTMGCGDNDLTCLAQGGQALGSQEFVFGSMTKSGASWTIKLQSLNIATGQLNNSIEREVSAVELSEAALGKTAASLIDELYKIAPTPEELPPDESSGNVVDPGELELDEADKPPRESALVWGPYSPRPSWKLAAVGVTGGLTLASLGTAIATTIMIGPNGSLRDDLITAAENSLLDDRPSNDIDPSIEGDLCPIARQPPDPTRPEEVTNAEVTTVCIRAENLATVATASWVAAGVFAASTAVFTVLLFVHKKDATVAKLVERDVGLGGAPLQDGGFVLGGSFKF